MTSLGEILAKERAARGLSIDEVSKVTKIQPKFIKALEAEDFKPFSAPIYIKGFLRTYAQYLGFEPEKILTAYKESWARAELARKNLLPKKEYPFDISRSSQKYLIPVVSIIFIVLAVLSYLYQTDMWRQKGQYPPQTEKGAELPETKISDKFQKEKEPLAQPPLQSIQAPILTLEEKPGPSETPAIQQHPKVSEQTGETTIQHPEVFIPEEGGAMGQAAKGVIKEAGKTTPPPLILTIDALEDAWLRVSPDGMSQEDILLQAGMSKEWSAQEKFVLIIGHVAGTKLRLNGKEIPLPYTKIDVLSDFVLTKKDIP